MPSGSDTTSDDENGRVSVDSELEGVLPLSEYFKGDGKKILADFVKRYGEVKGKRMFYATANKRGLAPKRKVKKR